MRIVPFLLPALVALPACTGPAPAEPRPAVEPAPEAAEPVPEPAEPLPEAAATHVTHGPDFQVTWRAVPAPIPLNTPFELELRLETEDGAPLTGARVQVDAWMPAHFHGMLRRPEVVDAGAGTYRVKGMLFHMRGHWELRFDLIDGEGVRTRATSDVELR